MSGENRTVLIALDGSDAADNAFDTYLKLLKYPGDHVLLLTCKEMNLVLDSLWNEAVFNYDPDTLQAQLQKEEVDKRAMMIPYGDRLHGAGITFKSLILVSQNPGQSILHAAQSEKAQIIVMGSRGHSKLRRTFLGSVCDFVMNHSPVPVVVCRQQQ